METAMFIKKSETGKILFDALVLTIICSYGIINKEKLKEARYEQTCYKGLTCKC